MFLYSISGFCFSDYRFQLPENPKGCFICIQMVFGIIFGRILFEGAGHMQIFGEGEQSYANLGRWELYY